MGGVSVEFTEFPDFPDPVEHCIEMAHGPLPVHALAVYVATPEYPEIPGAMYHSKQEWHAWFSQVEGYQGTFKYAVSLEDRISFCKDVTRIVQKFYKFSYSELYLI